MLSISPQIQGRFVPASIMKCLQVIHHNNNTLRNSISASEVFISKNLLPQLTDQTVTIQNLLFVSVVIPTRDRGKELTTCLQSIAKQNYPKNRLEVIISDDGSKSNIEHIIAPFHTQLCIRYIRGQSPAGPAAARNAGWRVSRGEIVVFLDDDVITTRTHLMALIQTLISSDDNIPGVAGPVLPLSGEWRQDPFTIVPVFEGPGGAGTIVTANLAVWRSTLEKVGGFDEGFRYPFCEDFDLIWRVEKALGPFGFAPEAIVYHPVRRLSLPVWLARLPQGSEAVIRLYRKHPDRFPPQFLPAYLLNLLRRTIFRKTTFGSVFLYFIINLIVWWIHNRYAWLRHPLLGLKGVAWVIVSILYLFPDSTEHGFMLLIGNKSYTFDLIVKNCKTSYLPIWLKI
jgi:glycosyltransferase involved in cell wall biosynthesis